MLRFLVVMATVATVSGIFFSQRHDHRYHRYCCSPHKWEQFIWGVGGLNTPERTEKLGEAVWSTSLMSFDKHRQRVYLYSNATIGTNVTSTKTIEDLKRGYKYTLDMKTNKCVKSKTQVNFDNGCVPNNAAYLARSFYGMGNDTLYVGVYRYTVFSPLVAIESFLMVSEDMCLPVSETLRGKFNNVGMTFSLNYLQTTLGIKDPSVFNLPDACKRTEKTGSPTSRLETLLGLP